MTDEEIQRTAVPHLGGQFERGLPVLFTGSGFSRGGKNVQGNPVSLVGELKQALWNVCFPGLPYDGSTPLQEIFEHALMRHKNQLIELLSAHFCVDADSIPEWYARIFRLAWFRTYTLNIDDLESGIQRQFQIDRRLSTISATTDHLMEAGDYPIRSDVLDVVHLNGKLADGPSKITFSVTQYAERLARQEPWYVRLASELLTHSFVFIGSQLDESPLWQHVELRRGRGQQTRELRPRSYLVSPQLNPAREALLANYNIAWIRMDAEAFTHNVLSQLEGYSLRGRKALAHLSSPLRPRKLEDVAVLASTSNQLTRKTEYLLGAEPTWGDIQTGRAIERNCDQGLWEEVKNLRDQSAIPGCFIVTGTAGSGKSSALMRLCLRLSAAGVKVGWCESELSLTPREIRLSSREEPTPDVIAIDDADVYGSEASAMVREIATNEPFPLVLLGIRSGRLDRVLKVSILGDVPVREFPMPNLEDGDIDLLLDALERENRLGLLRGMCRADQCRTFREFSGRQLLVAMIRATSGKDLQEKAVAEFGELVSAARRIYGLVCLASAHRIGLFREEVVFGSGDTSNSSLNELDTLLRRNLLRLGSDRMIYTRHRVVAELVRDELQRSGEIKELISGLAQIAASKVTPTMPRNTRPWRILRAMINHDFLIRAVGLEVARNIFGELEDIINWDYHYWLQRGSLEVEAGDLTLAQNFLDQAKGLAPTDRYVETERAYLWFAQAIQEPGTERSRSLADDAERLLKDLISEFGNTDPYPFHILGSQGMAWSRRAFTSSPARASYLYSLAATLQEGILRHPRDEDLKQLLIDLKREYLSIATGGRQLRIDDQWPSSQTS